MGNAAPNSAPAAPRMRRWMADLPAACTLGELRAIPATHNSACFRCSPSAGVAGLGWSWAQTQNSSIADQLRMGVRCLDLRLTHAVGGAAGSEGALQVTHTMASDHTLRSVLESVRDFLSENATEFVLITVKRDWKHRATW